MPDKILKSRILYKTLVSVNLTWMEESLVLFSTTEYTHQIYNNLNNNLSSVFNTASTHV
jgi:hypothetical protein